MPRTSSSLFRELVPEIIRAAPLGRSSTSQIMVSTAALALPFSGGADTLTLSVSPSQPLIPEFEAPGTTLTLSLLEMPAAPLSDGFLLGDTVTSEA